MSLIFYPSASIGAVIDLTLKDRKYIDINGVERPFNWWEENAFYHYDYLLSSAFYNIEIPNFRQKMKLPDRVHIMGDSGGFQAINQQVEADPFSVLRWQEKNCEIGMIFDKPPVEMDGGWASASSVPEAQFRKAAQTTKDNIEFILDKREKETPYNMKLYNVLQGSNKKEIEMWWDYVGDIELGGWSLGVKPPTPKMVAFMLSFLIGKGYKGPVHLLGMSGVNTIATAAYATKFFERVYIDSSSFARGMTAREYAMPTNIRNKLFFGDNDRNENGEAKLKEWPCICPVCSNLHPPRELEASVTASAFGALISLHDLYQYIMLVKSFDALMEDREEFMAFVKSNCKKDVFTAFEYMDCAEKNGFDDAYNIFEGTGSMELDEFF